jgi:glutathione reductase (NADPH)
MFDFDLFIIGAGSGGVRAGRIASNLGARVAIAEEYRIGGTCVIRGCVPKKLFVYASHFAQDFEDAVGFGWQLGERKFSWPTLIANKDKEIDRLNALYINTLNNAGVTMYNERATIKDKNTVLLADGGEISAEKILIATGGTPFKPEITGIEHAITSNEAFHLDELPPRVLVSGAGYIAVEFAAIFNGLGSNVELAYRGDMVLRGFDDDLRSRLEVEMQSQGIKVHLHTQVEKIEKVSDGLNVTFHNGDISQYDAVFFATGRIANTANLGLEKAGVKLAKNGSIQVDEFSRTNIDNIFAVGDVTDRIALTPVAIKEGHAFALSEFGNNPTSPQHDNVASAVFSQLPIATVGPTELEAIATYGEVDVYVSDFKPMKYTLGGRDERAFIKMLVDPKTDKVIAAHMIGPDAPEIIQGIAIAVKSGVTKAQFDSTVAIHPSSAEEFVLMSSKRD